MKIYAYVFFSKNLIVLVQTLMFVDPFFPVNFCVWCEVGVQRHYLWIKKKAFNFQSVVFMIFLIKNIEREYIIIDLSLSLATFGKIFIAAG